MSLLMKALEKAAKDRGEAQPPPVEPPPQAAAMAVETAAAAPKAAMELSLEPLSADTPPPHRPETGPQQKPSTRLARDQARAATVLQATARAAPAAAGRSSRIRPVIAIGIITAICAVALAVYVYLQITNPGLFISRPPSVPPSPLSQAPAAKPAAPIATGSVIAPATPVESAPSPAAVAEPAPVERRQAAKPPAAPAPRTAEAPRDSIRISPGSAVPQLDPRLAQGYTALQSGNLEAARQAYGDAARNEPRSVQALLGLAAIAMLEARADDASRLYFSVLDLEPRNAYAQAGLIALMGKADPVSAEARLKQLIAREPLASLYFTLGNLYGDQSRWAEAQQAYFRAHNLEPGNPDYAYNLAVGLEHVGQTRLAANFYQHAVARATAAGRAGFDLSQAQERIRLLASQPQ